MAITNYTQLKTAIANWLNRADLAAMIPDFITFCEADLNRKLRWRMMLVRDVIVAPSADEDYENLPADFLALKMVRFNTDPPKYPKYATPDMIGHWRAENNGCQGTPDWYSILGTQILFDRTPSGSPQLELLSYVRIPALNDTTQTSNLLLDQNPDIYVYGSLLHAEPYLKNDPRLETWGGLYAAGIDSLHADDKRAETSPSPLVARPKRSF